MRAASSFMFYTLNCHKTYTKEVEFKLQVINWFQLIPKLTTFGNHQANDGGKNVQFISNYEKTGNKIVMYLLQAEHLSQQIWDAHLTVSEFKYCHFDRFFHVFIFFLPNHDILTNLGKTNTKKNLLQL